MNRLTVSRPIAHRAALLALCLATLAPVALPPVSALAAPPKKAAAAKKTSVKKQAPAKKVTRRSRSHHSGNSAEFARAYKRHMDAQMIMRTGPVTGPMFSNRW